MSRKEKIQYMRIALSIIHIGLKDVDVDKIICIYESILEKTGSLNLKDIATIEIDCEKRNQNKIL